MIFDPQDFDEVQLPAQESDTSTPPDADLPATDGPDPFTPPWVNFDRLELRQKPTTIYTGTRPPNNGFFQVLKFKIGTNPSDCLNCFPVLLFKHRDGGPYDSTYYVLPGSPAHEAIGSDAKRAILVLGQTYSTREAFILEIVMPTGGPGDSWLQSRLDAAHEASNDWIKLKAAGNRYEIIRPVSKFPPPSWDQFNFPELALLGGRNRVLQSLDQQVVKDFIGSR